MRMWLADAREGWRGLPDCLAVSTEWGCFGPRQPDRSARASWLGKTTISIEHPVQREDGNAGRVLQTSFVSISAELTRLE